MSKGKDTLEDFLNGQVDFTRELVDDARTANFSAAEGTFECPTCGSALVKRHGKNGDFWSCANFPTCKTSFDDDHGKPNFLNADAPKCPTCGSALVKRHGKNGDFWGCTNYPRCRTTFEDKAGKPDFDGKKFFRVPMSSEEFIAMTSDD